MNNYDADVFDELKNAQLDQEQHYLADVFDESQLSTIRFYQMTDYYGRPKFDYELSIGVINAFFPNFAKPNYTLKAKVVEYQLSQKPSNGGENSTLMSFSPSIKLLLDSLTEDGKSLSELRKLGLICCTINKEVDINKINIDDFYMVSEIRMPDEISEIELTADEKSNQFVNISLVKLTDIRTDSGLSIAFGKVGTNNRLDNNFKAYGLSVFKFLLNNLTYQSNGIIGKTIIDKDDLNNFRPYCLIPVEINNTIRFANFWIWDRFSGNNHMADQVDMSIVNLSNYLNLGTNINVKGSTMILQPNELKSITFNDGVIETGRINTQAKTYNLTMPIIWNTAGAVSTWPTLEIQGIVGATLSTSNYILSNLNGYNRSTYSGFRKFGRVDIVLNDTKKTTLFNLLLDLIGTTYNIRRGFKDATYDSQGNPSNDIAKLKNDLGSQSPQAYITNKIKQWELENPTLVEDPIYKINFFSIIAMLSKYIDCDYSINGGTSINQWLLGMYAELTSTPVKEAGGLYTYRTAYVKFKKNKLISRFIDKKDDDFIVGGYSIIEGEDTIYWPTINKIIEPQTITFYPSKINGDDNYKKYIFIGDNWDDAKQRTSSPFGLSPVEFRFYFPKEIKLYFHSTEDRKYENYINKIQNITITGYGFDKFKNVDIKFKNKDDVEEKGTILIDASTNTYYAKNQSLAEMKINL